MLEARLIAHVIMAQKFLRQHDFLWMYVYYEFNFIQHTEIQKYEHPTR